MADQINQSKALEEYQEHNGLRVGEDVWVWDGKRRGWEKWGDIGDNSCFYSKGYITRISRETNPFGGEGIVVEVRRYGYMLDQSYRVFETAIVKIGAPDKNQSHMGEYPYNAACRYLPELMQKVHDDKITPLVLGRVLRSIAEYRGGF